MQEIIFRNIRHHNMANVESAESHCPSQGLQRIQVKCIAARMGMYILIALNGRIKCEEKSRHMG